jgi:hypothetical protein
MSQEQLTDFWNKMAEPWFKLSIPNQPFLLAHLFQYHILFEAQSILEFQVGGARQVSLLSVSVLSNRSQLLP